MMRNILLLSVGLKNRCYYSQKIDANFLMNITFTQSKIVEKTEKRSLENTDKTFAYAYYLPQEWSEEQILKSLDPNRNFIKEVRLVRDSLAKSTGKALLIMKNEKSVELIQKRYTEGMLDTKDVLQRIAIKPFELKKKEDKPVILRKKRQIYIAGLPREMNNEDLLDLLADYGDIENVQIPKDTDQKRNKGYALVLFTRTEEALQFQEQMNGKKFLGKKILIQSKDFIFDSQKKSFGKWSTEQLKEHMEEFTTNNYKESLKTLERMQSYLDNNQ